ncbi:MAG: hypothetical protein AAGB34_04345 [Planctomycetota bacterium]
MRLDKNVDDLIGYASAISGLPEDDLASRKQNKIYMPIRRALMDVLRHEAGFTLDRIGEYLHKDYTTIIHNLGCPDTEERKNYRELLTNYWYEQLELDLKESIRINSVE